MLIHLTTTNCSQGQLLFDLPNIYFDPKLTYEVSVREAYFRARYGVKTNYPIFWSIISNLVDKSSANPNQEICSGFVQAKRNLSSVARTFPLKYILQHTEINTSVFKLITYESDVSFDKIFTDENNEIEFARIVLEVHERIHYPNTK